MLNSSWITFKLPPISDWPILDSIPPAIDSAQYNTDSPILSWGQFVTVEPESNIWIYVTLGLLVLLILWIAYRRDVKEKFKNRKESL